MPRGLRRSVGPGRAERRAGGWTSGIFIGISREYAVATSSDMMRLWRLVAASGRVKGVLWALETSR